MPGLLVNKQVRMEGFVVFNYEVRQLFLSRSSCAVLCAFQEPPARRRILSALPGSDDCCPAAMIPDEISGRAPGNEQLGCSGDTQAMGFGVRGV